MAAPSFLTIQRRPIAQPVEPAWLKDASSPSHSAKSLAFPYFATPQGPEGITGAPLLVSPTSRDVRDFDFVDTGATRRSHGRHIVRSLSPHHKANRPTNITVDVNYLLHIISL